MGARSLPCGEPTEKDVGHSPPGVLRTHSGELLHVDFGVSRDDYCSDLQRVWYFLDGEETSAPDDVRRAWDALWASVDAGVAVLRPGAAGWEMDAAARESLVAAGYPEPMYALGDQLGREARRRRHGSRPALGSLGTAPFGVVEEGNVSTLEDGTAVPGRGYIGLEEDCSSPPRASRGSPRHSARCGSWQRQSTATPRAAPRPTSAVEPRRAPRRRCRPCRQSLPTSPRGGTERRLRRRARHSSPRGSARRRRGTPRGRGGRCPPRSWFEPASARPRQARENAREDRRSRCRDERDRPWRRSRRPVPATRARRCPGVAPDGRPRGTGTARRPPVRRFRGAASPLPRSV